MENKIKFNEPSITKLEEEYVIDALHNSKLSGDGKYTSKVYDFFKERFGIQHMLLTTSGTTALEMASILSELNPGDEVIVPSFTFSSTANAFMLRGAKPIFCDIRKDTWNIDERKIEELITDKTKAIYVVDYAGIPVEMDEIISISKRHNIPVIEDAAQAVGSTYKGQYAGTFTEFGCYSFHETKNYAMGEGGGIVINDEKYMDRAEIIREKGTNRRQVLRGEVDKYTWHDIGSSFLPSDVLAAILYAQLKRYDEIMNKRCLIWNTYKEELSEVEKKGDLVLPHFPEYITHNGHMFNILLPNSSVRDTLIKELQNNYIYPYICYIPLHSAPEGIKLGYRPEDVPITEDIGNRMLRLPLHANMTKSDAEKVVENIILALNK